MLYCYPGTLLFCDNYNIAAFRHINICKVSLDHHHHHHSYSYSLAKLILVSFIKQMFCCTERADVESGVFIRFELFESDSWSNRCTCIKYLYQSKYI